MTLVLHSLGTQYAQQSYKVSDTFPFKWINKKWKEGFYVTAMATAGSRWAVVMSRNAGFTSQVCVTVPLVFSVHNLTVEWNWLVDLLKLIWKEFKILWICELGITKVPLLKHNTDIPISFVGSGAWFLISEWGHPYALGQWLSHHGNGCHMGPGGLYLEHTKEKAYWWNPGDPENICFS
jgi:hypothetical protein